MDDFDRKLSSSSSTMNKQRHPFPKWVDDNGKSWSSPKKNILTDWNDSLDDLFKTPAPGPNILLRKAAGSGSRGELQRAPRCLRYNTSRRREVRNRRESDDVAPSDEWAQLEGGGAEESDGEGGWGFAGALMRLVTLLLVLVLFTSYIVSMNDTTTSPVAEAVVVQDHVSELVNQNLVGFRVSDMEIMEESGGMVDEDEED